MEIVLQIVLETDEEYDTMKNLLNKETPLDDLATKEYTFYNIDHISPLEEGFTLISVAGEDYVAKMKYDTLKTIITAQRNLLTFFN
jgi:hypothetical protein